MILCRLCSPGQAFLTVCALTQEIQFDDPLFEGGDCEDWAQTFMQFIFNIDKQFPQLIDSMKLYFGESSNAVIFLNNIFGDISKSSLSIYMARGIYVDAGQHDQNHTFSVARHSSENHCSFSIIENVLPTFVLNIKENQCETVRTQFLQKTHPDPVYYTIGDCFYYFYEFSVFGVFVFIEIFTILKKCIGVQLTTWCVLQMRSQSDVNGASYCKVIMFSDVLKLTTIY